MNVATSLVARASGELVARSHRPASHTVAVDAALGGGSNDAVRPSRIGGPALAGAHAIDAYQRTASIDAIVVLSRIDEHA